jgi:hypothetical protein
MMLLTFGGSLADIETTRNVDAGGAGLLACMWRARVHYLATHRRFAAMPHEQTIKD